MKLTKSQNEKYENEVRSDAYYWLKAILGEDTKIEKDVNFTTEKYMIGSTAVYVIYCKGFAKEYNIGRNGKLSVYNR